MKYKIEKNTVQETLIIPLYARKVCSELYPNLYQDETAVRLINEIDYDFSDADKNARKIQEQTEQQEKNGAFFNPPHGCPPPFHVQWAARA